MDIEWTKDELTVIKQMALNVPVAMKDPLHALLHGLILKCDEAAARLVKAEGEKKP